MFKLRLLAGIAVSASLAPIAAADDCNMISLKDSDECTYTLGELSDGEVDAGSLKISLNSPSVPAGSIIGASDISLTNVRSFSDLTPQLLNGFDENFEYQPGIAIAGTPYWWLRRRESLGDYREGSGATERFARIMKRTQFGLATKLEPADSDVESDTSLMGFSLSWQLFDQQDVRSSHFRGAQDCLATEALKLAPAIYQRTIEEEAIVAREVFKENPQAFNAALQSIGLPTTPTINDPWFVGDDALYIILLLQNENVGGAAAITFGDLMNTKRDEVQDQIDQKKAMFKAELTKIAPVDDKSFAKSQKACNDKFTQGLKDNDSLVFTIASGLESDTGKLDDLAQERTSAWLAYKKGNVLPLPGGAPILGLVSYSSNEEVSIDDDTKAKADRWTLGVGTSWEQKDQASLDLQVSWIDTNFDDPMFEDSEEYRLTASYSRKLRDNVWIEFSAGATNSDKLEDARFAGIALKVDWAAQWRQLAGLGD